jgi:hypothetical protein
MNEDKDKPQKRIFRILGMKRSGETKPEQTNQDTSPLELRPAMPELGTAPCPVCGQQVAVFVTRTKRPFINCGFCSARVFYNGSRSQRMLQDQIKAPKRSAKEKP